MKKSVRIFCSIALFVTTSVNAATIFAPTDGDVNFLDISSTDINWSYELYMFDDNTVVGSGLNAADGLLVPMPSIVGINGPFGNDYLATNMHSQTLTLTGSDHFLLAVHNLDTGEWIEDSGAVSLGANTQRIQFEYYNGAPNPVVLAVDVEIISSVPVPAAVWLFTSGLIGFSAIGRKKKPQQNNPVQTVLAMG